MTVFTETREVVCHARPHRLANIPPPTESKGEDSADLFPFKTKVLQVLERLIRRFLPLQKYT